MSGFHSSKNLTSSSVWSDTEPASQSRLLTTADTAKVLGLSPRRIRQLAKAGDLASEPTRSGQLVFHWGEVQRCWLRRSDVQTRSRPETLRAIHLARSRTGYTPRQLSLLSALERSLRLVRSGPGERSFPDREVKASDSFDNTQGSDTGDSVNRKAAGSQR